MKRLKKVMAFVVSLSVCVLMFSGLVFAAGTEFRFSDPTTTVGATFEVTAKLTSDEDMGTVEASLTYDSASLKFVSGEGATDNGGQLQLASAGGSTELTWNLQFQALAEGSTAIQVDTVTASSSTGSSLQVTTGNSSVTIGAGDPSLITDTTPAPANGVQVQVDGAVYTIADDFSDVLIPEGFTKTEMTYEGSAYQATIQESSGKYAVYLADAAGEKDFFLYDPNDGKFAPFKQIDISQEHFIVLLNTQENTALPDNFQETTITVDGKTFPAWQNVDDADYYLVYALNGNGDSGFYQYDSVDETYQRYTPEEVKKEETASKSFLGKVSEKVKDYLDIFIVGVAALFLLLLILLIVLAAKLRNRNVELDDLYDEYDIDMEEEEEKPAKGKKEKTGKSDSRKSEPAVRKPAKKVKIEEEDDFDEEDYEEEDDEEEDYEEEDYEAVDAEEIEDLDTMLDEKTKKKHGHTETDDLFKVDFIDLD